MKEQLAIQTHKEFMLLMTYTSPALSIHSLSQFL